MHEIKRVLVPVDFSDEAKIAIHYAINLVGEDDECQVMLIHVASPETTKTDELILNALLEETRTDWIHSDKVTCDYLIKSGDLTDAIIATQKEMNSDLIVMGTKGAWTQESISNTARVVLRTDCPVLAVPEITPSLFISKLVLAIDDHQIDGLFSLKVVEDIAKSTNAKVHALSINNGIDLDQAIRNQQILESNFTNQEYKKSIRRGDDIEREIAVFMKDYDIDLLTVFLRNLVNDEAPSEGKLIKVLTNHAHVPLLIISK